MKVCTIVEWDQKVRWSSFGVKVIDAWPSIFVIQHEYLGTFGLLFTGTGQYYLRSILHGSF